MIRIKIYALVDQQRGSKMFLPVLVILCCLSISAETAQIGQIPVTVTELTTPHIRLYGAVWSMIPHPSDRDKLIITDDNAAWNFDPRTKSKSLIAGSSSSGYQEGIGQNARFTSPRGITSVNETVVAIVDSLNACIRLVNLITNTTEHYAGTCRSAGYQDGTRSTAQFYRPDGITRVGRDFFVCDYLNNKIRQISDSIVSTLASNINRPSYLSSTEMNLLFSFNHGVGAVDLRSSKMTTITGGSSSGLLDGSLTAARFSYPRGIVYVTETVYAVAVHKAVRLIDNNKRIVSTLNIPEIGSASTWSVLVYNGTLLVGLTNGRLLSLSLSDLPGAVEVVCPQDYTVTLSDNSHKINITIPQPRIDESRLSCINCPDSVQIFDEGFYNLTFDYLDKYFNETTSCSYVITVIKPDTTPVCTNETVKVYLERNQTSSKEIEIKELGATLTLGVGDLKIKLNSGCFKIFRVYGWTEMKRAVQLQTSYQIKCTSLNKLAFMTIDANLKQPTNFLEDFCPECQINGNNPVIQCVNETLTVIWKTGITSNRKWLVDKEKERTILQSSLIKFQKKYTEIDITAFVNLVPRTISPIKDISGLYIKVVTTAECQDNNFLYDREADVCVRTRCSSSD